MEYEGTAGKRNPYCPSTGLLAFLCTRQKDLAIAVHAAIRAGMM